MVRILCLLLVLGCGVKTNSGGIDYADKLSSVNSASILKAEDLFEAIPSCTNNIKTLKTLYAKNEKPDSILLQRTAELLKGIREYCPKSSSELEFEACAKFYTFEDNNETTLTKIHAAFD